MGHIPRSIIVTDLFDWERRREDQGYVVGAKVQADAKVCRKATNAVPITAQQRIWLHMWYSSTPRVPVMSVARSIGEENRIIIHFSGLCADMFC